jgi:cyanophycinase-like exopeptidase
VSGPVVLHGGGEFEAGDEPCLTAIVEHATRAAQARGGHDLRVAVVPTAAARYSPALSAAHDADFVRVAAKAGRGAVAIPAMIVDETSAADPDLAARLADTDLVYFPGGDPDRIPLVLRGSAAWQAIAQAHARGAVIGGASAGAMAMATWTWTPDGGTTGLAVVPGLAVRPHADAATWASTVERFAAGVPAGLGLLGIPERTIAITDDPDTDPIVWRVVGERDILWQPTRGGSTVATPPGGIFATER